MAASLLCPAQQRTQQQAGSRTLLALLSTLLMRLCDACHLCCQLRHQVWFLQPGSWPLLAAVQCKRPSLKHARWPQEGCLLHALLEVYQAPAHEAPGCREEQMWLQVLQQLLSAYTQEDMAVCGELFELCDVEVPSWGMSAESDIVPEEIAVVMQQVLLRV